MLNQTATDSEGYSLSSPFEVNTSDSTYAFLLGFIPYSQDNALTKCTITPTGERTIFAGWAIIDDALNLLDNVQFQSLIY